ncbi:hypothetical protein BDV96DRAFT_603087 [Lophiotrema nucula]|uniref:Uncharacterized protein n=1 Tax=Lophiotrema nucula TaxID=690887 RepID=A0A6A5YXG0_9PLEO|nr:hypothetical protein BDV96DRAFT_603087 [Lophiotrema nucula]
MTKCHFSSFTLFSILIAASSTSAAAIQSQPHSPPHQRTCTFTAYQKQMCAHSHTTPPADASSVKPWTYFSIPSILDADGKLIVNVLSERPESEHNSLTRISVEKALEIGIPAEKWSGEVIVQGIEEEFERLDALTVRVDEEGEREGDVVFGFRGAQWTSEDREARGTDAWCEAHEWDTPCLHCGGGSGTLPRGRYMNCTFPC